MEMDEKDTLLPKGNSNDPTKGPINGMMWTIGNQVCIFSDGKWEELMPIEDFEHIHFLAEKENMSFNEYIRCELDKLEKKHNDET